MTWYTSAYFLLKLAFSSVMLWAFFVHPRRKVAKTAGNLLLIVVDSKKQRWQILGGGLCAVIAASLIAVELLVTKEIGLRVLDLWMFVVAVLFAVPWFRCGPAYLEIHENGLIQSGTHFFDWDQVRGFKWLGSPPNTLFVRTSHFVFNHRIAEHQRREVTWLLSQHSKVVDATAGAA